MTDERWPSLVETLLAEDQARWDAEMRRLEDVPLLCARCRSDLKGDGSLDVPLGCGACRATICAACRLIWAADGPCVDQHHNCGMLGHLTLSEQPKFPVAVKR